MYMMSQKIQSNSTASFAAATQANLVMYWTRHMNDKSL